MEGLGWDAPGSQISMQNQGEKGRKLEKGG
jgi:hypothetical protein